MRAVGGVGGGVGLFGFRVEGLGQGFLLEATVAAKHRELLAVSVVLVFGLTHARIGFLET